MLVYLLEPRSIPNFDSLLYNLPQTSSRNCVISELSCHRTVYIHLHRCHYAATNKKYLRRQSDLAQKTRFSHRTHIFHFTDPAQKIITNSLAFVANFIFFSLRICNNCLIKISIWRIICIWNLLHTRYYFNICFSPDKTDHNIVLNKFQIMLRWYTVCKIFYWLIYSLFSHINNTHSLSH